MHRLANVILEPQPCGFSAGFSTLIIPQRGVNCDGLQNHHSTARQIGRRVENAACIAPEGYLPRQQTNEASPGTGPRLKYAQWPPRPRLGSPQSELTINRGSKTRVVRLGRPSSRNVGNATAAERSVWKMLHCRHLQLGHSCHTLSSDNLEHSP
jgi:hypothetical protein